MTMQYAKRMLIALVALQVLLAELVPVAMARQGPHGVMGLICNMLPIAECAFAVDSHGRRCVLETLSGGVDWHVCQTSDVMVSEGYPLGYVETEACVKSCGVAKMTVGLSTDALLSDEFTSRLCSSDCQENCANLVDLYSSLASGEGNSLRLMCANHHHRRMETEVFDTTLLATADREVLAEEPAPAASSGA